MRGSLCSMPRRKPCASASATPAASCGTRLRSSAQQRPSSSGTSGTRCQWTRAQGRASIAGRFNSAHRAASGRTRCAPLASTRTMISITAVDLCRREGSRDDRRTVHRAVPRPAPAPAPETGARRNPPEREGDLLRCGPPVTRKLPRIHADTEHGTSPPAPLLCLQAKERGSKCGEALIRSIVDIPRSPPLSIAAQD